MVKLKYQLMVGQVILHRGGIQAFSSAVILMLINLNQKKRNVKSFITHVVSLPSEWKYHCYIKSILILSVVQHTRERKSSNTCKVCFNYWLYYYVSTIPYIIHPRLHIIHTLSFYYNTTDVPNNDRPIIVGDPGAVKLLSYQKFVNGQSVGSGHVLSRKQYYHEIGMNKYNLQIQDKMKRIEDINQQMSVNHCKHWSIEHLLVGLQTVVHNRDRLFKSMFNKCWEWANFAIYSKKQTVVTRALNSLQDPTEPDIVVIYGDGSFASGGRGQRSVPVKWFKDACKNRFLDAFEEVDEHRTSSICPDCATQLYSVIQFFNGKRYEVRGLMWCSSYKCRGWPFKDRDSHVACNNMYSLASHHGTQWTRMGA